MKVYQFTHFEEFVQVYDPFADETPVYLTVSSGYILDPNGRDRDPGVYVIASFQHEEDTYVCYERAKDYAEEVEKHDRWDFLLRRRGYVVRPGVVTDAWPVLALGRETRVPSA